MTVSPELSARFQADLFYDQREGGLGLAVSGGPDSLALLLLTAAAGRGRFEAATVDHGLRPESAAEAGFVAETCARLGVPHATLRVTVGPGNLQAEARAARYAALSAWAQERGLGTIATAHHADDQAETMLMRLGRGSGVRGLAGIARESYPFDCGLALVRPLLAWRKAELAGVVAAAGLTPVNDPSNENSDFERVRARQLLQQAKWLDPMALAASAAHLSEANSVLAMVSSAEWTGQVRNDGHGLRYRPLQPAVIRQWIVERAIHAISGRTPRGSAVAALERKLSEGGNGNLGGVLARVVDGEWVFEPEPPRSL